MHRDPEKTAQAEVLPWRTSARARRWDRILRWMTNGFFGALVLGTALYFAFLWGLVEPAIW